MERRTAGLITAVALSGCYSFPQVRHLGYLPARVTLESGKADVIGSDLPPGLSARVGPLLPSWDRLGRGPMRSEHFGPDRVRYVGGRAAQTQAPFGAKGRARAADADLDLDGHRIGRRWARLAGRRPRVFARRPGIYPLEIGAFGIPLRTIRVEAIDTPTMVAGGDSIGIRIETAGVLVTGGPGLRAPRVLLGWTGLRPGDRIVGADGHRVLHVDDLRAAVERSGRAHRTVRLRLVRQGQATEVRVQPRLDLGGRRYRLGVRVREGLTGIGTLTWYDPRSRLFAALGHRVEDGLSGQPIPVTGGAVRPSAILGVERAVMGRPGEKIGVLTSGTDLGRIVGGGTYGIYGYLVTSPEGPRLPLATIDEVHPGPAVIRTVVGGSHVDTFRIRIERVDPRAPGGRGLVIRVTDPRLMEAAGGIVQGMSGSPIIEDGRLAGAVTHVLVSDSLRGYGVFALWMWREALSQTREEKAHIQAKGTRMESKAVGPLPIRHDPTRRAG